MGHAADAGLLGRTTTATTSARGDLGNELIRQDKDKVTEKAIRETFDGVRRQLLYMPAVPERIGVHQNPPSFNADRICLKRRRQNKKITWGYKGHGHSGSN